MALACDFSDLPSAAVPGIKAGLSKSHILNEEIGKIAADANPKQIILTHLAGGTDLEGNIDLYKKAGYSGKVIQAYDGLMVT
jgi:ribonuclease BN (tRNA processing enzyme)